MANYQIDLVLRPKLVLEVVLIQQVKSPSVKLNISQEDVIKCSFWQKADACVSVSTDQRTGCKNFTKEQCLLYQTDSVLSLLLFVVCHHRRHQHFYFDPRLKIFLFWKSFPHSCLSLAEAHLLEFDHSVFGSHWRWKCWWMWQIK